MSFVFWFTIGFVVFSWLIAFFTVLTKDFKQPSNKIVWMLLLIFLAPLGAVLFMFFGFQQLDKEKEEIEVVKYFQLVTTSEDDAISIINELKQVPKDKIKNTLTKLIREKPNERRLANSIKDGYIALRILPDEVADLMSTMENYDISSYPIRYDFKGKEQYFIYCLVDKKMEWIEI